MEIRCPNTLQAIIEDDEILEIKCRHPRCGAKSGVIVLHRFNVFTGRLIETQKFKDPMHKEVNTSAHRNQRSSIRSA